MSTRNDGYASLTALILCAALSIVCAGLLTLTFAQKKKAERDMLHLQQQEAINSAIMLFAADVLYAPGQDGMSAEKTVNDPGHPIWKVQLIAQPESRKWPISKLDDVDPIALSHATKLSKAQLKALATGDTGNGPKSDCVRSLFSDRGFADPGKDLPKGSGALFFATGKDGEIWRIRAVLGNRVEERRVRFLGDTRRMFALLSREEFSLGEMPACTDLIVKP